MSWINLLFRGMNKCHSPVRDRLYDYDEPITYDDLPDSKNSDGRIYLIVTDDAYNEHLYVLEEDGSRRKVDRKYVRQMANKE